MSVDTLVVSRQPGELWLATLDGDQVVDLIIRRDGLSAAGDIARGRVVTSLPGQKSVFVDLGNGETGLLDAGRAKLTEGQTVIAEVTRPAIQSKGPKLKQTDRSRAAEGQTGDAPGRLDAFSAHPAVELAQAVGTVTGVIAEPASEYLKLKSAFANAGCAVEVCAPSVGRSAFMDYDLENALDEALAPSIRLPSGGTMTITETEAVVAVDIDAGSSDPSVANAEVLAALPRQMRLRCLGGPMWVDVIPGAAHLSRAIAALKAAVAEDPVPVRVAGRTPLGRIEAVRDRHHIPISQLMTTPDNRWRADALALKALRSACHEGLNTPGKRIELHLPEAAAQCLEGPFKAAQTFVEDTLKVPVIVVTDPKLDPGRWQVAVPARP